MATPEHLKGAKNTPCRSGGISKSLLTPCRRVGLTRKVSTPVSRLQSSSNNVVSTPPQETVKIEKKNIKTAPTMNDASVIMEVQSCPSTEKVLVSKENVGNENIKRTTTSNTSRRTKESRVLTKTKNKQRDKLEAPKVADKVDIPRVVVNSCKQDFKNETDNTKQSTTFDAKHNADNSRLQSTQVDSKQNNSNTCKSDSNKLDSKKDSNSVGERNAEVSGRIVPNKTCTTKTKLLKRLSMKKSLSFSQDELTDLEELPKTPKSGMSSILAEEFIKDCAVESKGSDEDSSEPIILVQIKASRKRRVIYSSDEEDFVSLKKFEKRESDSANNSQEENWSLRINKVKKQIEIKSAHLTELKQAAVYRKLHDVGELNDLTAIWKKGCQDGLRDLLRKLQEHAHIDMPTLMQNLRVPPLIKFDTESDTFT